MLIIGIDTGGTFTDFVVFENGKIETFKLLSTLQNPEKTIIKGLKKYLQKDFILVHGTTVGTNAFLENKMAKTALLITKDFEDILKIGRQSRVNLFSLKPQKPSSVVSDKMIFGINERTLASGKIIKSIDKNEIVYLIEKIKKLKAESIAVIFLHSYKNPSNEKAVEKILKENGFRFITLSSRIFPEYREYERGIITVLNSALMPVISDYIEKIEKGIKGKKFYIMQSNGGGLSPRRIKKEPVRTLLSGPAGGLIASKLIAEETGEKNLITLDMGGTSTDVSVVKNGEFTLSKERVMNNLKIKVPMIEIETVGAGGGSIATVDRAGVLRVGPQSAGANPGPACYGKSDYPTITDAFVVLNIIDPSYFLGGKMKIYPQRSFKAIEKIAKKIRKSVYDTAEGIVKISISSIERALRTITVEKGDDPRFFALFPFGGAGGLVAAQLAKRLDIKRVIIPNYQGVFSALGMIFAEYTKEFSLSVLRKFSLKTKEYLQKEFRKLEKVADRILEEENIPKLKRRIIKLLDLRYFGQSYELTIPFSENFEKIFHKEHKKLYSYKLSDEDIEIVNIRVMANGKISDAFYSYDGERKKSVKPEKRKVYFNGKFENFYYYKRKNLYPDMKLKSPAIIISEFSTIVVPIEFKIKIDKFFNIVLERK